MTYLELMGFGPLGWGRPMLIAAAMTVAVASSGFVLGAVIGAGVAWAKLRRNLLIRGLADGYTTILRGVPDLLVIYLFYFGGSVALTAIGRWFGAEGFVGLPAFATGAAALGVVSGAYQAEVFRGAYLSLNRGELEAARAVGMPSFLMFRRVIAPQVMRLAIPGLGNVWQLVLKESALISVIGLIELLRQSQIGAGSTRQPFQFFLTAGALYLAITWVSTNLFKRAEIHSRRGVRSA